MNVYPLNTSLGKISIATLLRYVFNRNYMKVHDLFAKIEALVNAMFLTANLIFNHYLRFNYLLFLLLKIESEPKVLSENNLQSLAPFVNPSNLLLLRKLKSDNVNESQNINTLNRFDKLAKEIQ